MQNMVPPPKKASMTTKHYREFCGAVLRKIPDDIDPRLAQVWIENPEQLEKFLRSALIPPPPAPPKHSQDCNGGAGYTEEERVAPCCQEYSEDNGWNPHAVIKEARIKAWLNAASQGHAPEHTLDCPYVASGAESPRAWLNDIGTPDAFCCEFYEAMWSRVR